MWWLEDWRTNWEQVMGKSKWEWFRAYFPIHFIFLL